jgi:hypothetical protein
MAKKGKARRAARKAKVIVRRGSPRGGRLMTMFKTVIAVSGVAVVGGAALNMVNSARSKPAEGIAAGTIAFGGGALLAFLLGMFKGTRQYVTPVLAGAAAVGGLAALQGPINRGSASIANALLGRKADGGVAARIGSGASGASAGGMTEAQIVAAERQRMGQQGVGITGAVPTGARAGGGATAKPASAPRVSKGQAMIQTAGQFAELGASIARAVAGGGSPVAAAAGLDDYEVAGGGDDLDLDGGGEMDDLDGSEGMDDFAIAGAAVLDD